MLVLVLVFVLVLGLGLGFGCRRGTARRAPARHAAAPRRRSVCWLGLELGLGLGLG